jgi:hypothetical protein
VNSRTIEDPLVFTASLGGLHDVRIDEMAVNTDDQTLKLILNDINANFADTSEYQGCRPAVLVFQGVTALFLDIDTDEGIRISNVKIVAEPAMLRLDIHLNLGGGEASGGRRSVSAKFQALQIQDG